MRNLAIITCSGLNIEQNLSYLVHKEGVKVVKVTRHTAKRLSVVVPLQYCNKVVDYFEKKCYNDIIVQYSGMIRWWHGITKHVCLAIAIMLLLPIMWGNTRLLHSINITGDIDRNVVTECLNNYGLHKWGWIGNIHYDSIENYLSNKLQLNYCVVELKGNQLYVNCISTISLTPPIDYTKQRHIYATASGVIHSISIIQGTARVVVGQRVSKGDLLVEGVRIYNDDTQDTVYAIAEVVAQVATECTVMYTGTTTVLTDSGQYTNTMDINIGRTTVVRGKNDYIHFRTDSVMATLYPLDIELVQHTHYEQIPTVIDISFDQQLEWLRQSALDGVNNMAEYDISNVEYIVQDNASVTARAVGYVVISN